MKIGPLENKPLATPVAGERSGGTAKAGPQATDEPSAQVELSATASMLVDNEGSDFDAEKVARIAQAIQDGKFTVNAEAIADKLIANASELLGKTSH